MSALRIVVLVVLPFLLVACSPDSGSKSGSKSGSNSGVKLASGKTSNSSTTNVNAKKPEPPYIDAKQAFVGEGLYNQNCVACHQADAIGKPGLAPSLTNQEFLSIAPVSFLFETIRDGRAGTGMPPFKHLGDEKIKAIVAYLRDQSKLPSRITQVDNQPKTQGDPRIGRVLFRQVCATCHGPGGNGYESGGTGTAIGKKGFLDKVSDGFIRVTIKEGRSNTRMLPFQGPGGLADLSNKEIDDIIAYLRTAPGD